MALLDMQSMKAPRDGSDARCLPGSDLSVLLCDSFASVLVC
jgi:Lanthionine-containing peptide SapB precursor RamS